MKPKLLGIQQKILMKSVGNLWRKFKILYKHNSYKAIPKLFIVCQISYTQIFNSSLCITAYDVMVWCAIGIKTKKMFMFLIRIIPKVACFASGKTNYLKRLLLSFLFLYTFDCFVFCTSCFDEKENLIMETSFYCKTPSRSADDILFFDLIKIFFQILGFFCFIII